MQTPHVDIPATARAALDCAESVLSHWLPGGKRQGCEYLARNPTRHDDRPGSFSINLDTCKWADFASGAAGGDLVSLVAYLEGTRQGEAAHALAQFLGLRVNGTPRPERPQAAPEPEPMAAYGPIPPEALESRPQAHPRHGPPTAVWEYRDPAGRLLAYVRRFDPPGERKQFAPLTWTPGGGWQWKAPPEPRPLYGLDRLAAGPEAPALICEGEKAADAARALLPELVAVTTMNGAQSPGKADFGPLAGRRVLIWPDNDAPGAGYAAKVAELVRAAGTVSVEVLDLASLAVDPLSGEPRELPAGWDAADALADGWTNEALAERARWAAEPEGPQAGGAPRKTPDATEVTLIEAAGIRPEPVAWLWDGWLARGKVHILAGVPGTGKTTAALALAATLTTGGPWPDGSWAPVGDVVIWSGEDDPRDTLVPRLIAAGADLSRVRFVAGAVDKKGPRSWDPSTDMAALADELAHRPPALLIVDPVVSAVLGDSHKNAEVRRALQPLVDLAQARRCAVLGVSHFSKGSAGREPVDRVTGSLAFGALARVVLVTATLPEEEGGGRILARAKNNLGPDTGGFRCDLEPLELADHSGVHTTRVLWGEALDGTARELLARAEAQGDPEEATALGEAKLFLRSLLADGPLPAKQVMRDAHEAGHSERTLKRAKSALGVEVHKESGPKGQWLWCIPGRVPTSPVTNSWHPWHPSTEGAPLRDGKECQVWHPSNPLQEKANGEECQGCQENVTVNLGTLSAPFGADAWGEDIV